MNPENAVCQSNTPVTTSPTQTIIDVTPSGIFSSMNMMIANARNSNVILFVAMFIVGGALFETGMANKIGGVVTHFAKTERQLIIAIMVIVGVMSGFLSNTGTAAILIPVVIGIAAKSGYSRSKLLMPLVFAAAMGGNLSLIGAPGNMIAQSSMEKIGLKFGFFDYAKVGLPILIVGIIFFALFGYKFLPDKVDKAVRESLMRQKISAMFQSGNRPFH